MSLKIAIVAGEASGDLLGADLLRGLLSVNNQITAIGIGGPAMQAVGCISLFPLEELAVMGIIEPLKRLPRLLRIRKLLIKFFVHYRPDVFIGIDAPDFNLTLAAKLKQHGITTVHYVSPSVWAWRSYRVHKIARAVDLMMTLLPFEEQYYHNHQIPVQFVGHPLARAERYANPQPQDEQQAALGLAIGQPTLAVLPGSRAQELRYLGPVFLAAAALCKQAKPELQIITAAINEERQAQWQSLVQEHAPDLDIKCYARASTAVINAADVVLVASGTASLEVMLLHKPMVIAYRMGKLNFLLAKLLVKIKWIGLPNLLAGRLVAPEFIQDRASPSTLAAALLQYFTDMEAVATVKQTFMALSKELAVDNAQLAAGAIMALISKRNEQC